MKPYLLLLIPLLFACGETTTYYEDLIKYKCSKEQMELVNTEARVCIGGFTRAFCFAQAKITLCDKISNVTIN